MVTIAGRAGPLGLASGGETMPLDLFGSASVRRGGTVCDSNEGFRVILTSLDHRWLLTISGTRQANALAPSHSRSSLPPVSHWTLP